MNPGRHNSALTLRRPTGSTVEITNVDIYAAADVTVAFTHPDSSEAAFVQAWEEISSGQTKHIQLPPELHNTALSVQVAYNRAIPKSRFTRNFTV